MNLTDVHRAFHTTVSETEYVFSTTYVTFATVDCNKLDYTHTHTHTHTHAHTHTHTDLRYCSLFSR